MSNTKLKNKEFDIKKVNIGNVPENEDTFIPLQNNHGNNIKILNSGVKENYPNKMNISMKALVNYYETMEKVGKKKGIMFHDPNRAGFTSPSGIKYNKAVPNIDSSNNRRPGLALGYLGDRNHTKKITPISKFQPYTNIIKNNQNENSNSNDCMSSVKKKVEYYLSDNIQVALMSIATLFALFGLDLKIMYLNPIYDEFFNYALITVAVIFFLELFASIWVKEGYIKSFFFWLDLFASISMIFEIDSLLYSTLGFILSLKYEEENEIILIEKQRIQKIAVVVRILRIIRLIRVVKLYKTATVFMTNLEIKRRINKLNEVMKEKEKVEKKKASLEVGNINNVRDPKKNYTFKKEIDTMQECSVSPYAKTKINSNNTESANTHSNKKHIAKHNANFREDKLIEFNLYNKKIEQIKFNLSDTRISKLVSESITRKVIIIILLMLLISPITDDDAYTWENNIGYLMLCKVMNNMIHMNTSQVELNLPLKDHIENLSDINFPIIQIFHNTSSIWTNDTLISNTYRYEEKSISYLNDELIYVLYDNKYLTNLSAFLNILRTVFVIILLLYMAIVLNKDSKRSILKPLQIMKQMMDSIAYDPINHKKIKSMKDKVKTSMEKLNKFKREKGDAKHDKKRNSINVNEDAEYEIKILQLAIMKISALLAIGFGEAGGEILSENMRSQAGLNPMLPGKKITAIFGFCDIINFSEINIALQEKTMVLVNEIADIVHSSVDKYGGATNKNIGDAFLNVWKFDHLERFNSVGKAYVQSLDEGDHILNTRVADKALLSFLTILKRINCSAIINSYRDNDNIKSQFGGEFKIEMGFGLHLGWAIEGAIGSFYKIDCSYLSPHVNISARLESATKQYGVKLLLSSQLYDLLSDDLKMLLRLIDVVTLKGCEKPVKLYTVNYLNENMKISKQINKKNMSVQEKRNYYASKNRKMSKYESNEGTLNRFILNKKSFKNMLNDKIRPNLFYERFRDGVCAYITGDWEKAFENLKDAYYLDEGDGPTITLLKFIISNSIKSPKDWKGYRDLISK